jgi:hypothetical protein
LSRSHANEQIVWLLKGKMEFLFGSKQRACGQGDVIVMPGGTEHEAWFREGTEVIASSRRLPARRQTRLHERRLNSSLRLFTGRAHVQFAPRGAPATERGPLESRTDAGSAVIAQIASGLLEPTITA